MGRSCRELWKDYHFVLKIVTFIILLVIHFFLSDVYAACYQFYVFAIGYFYTAFINMIILLYAYVWFTNTFIWECCMIIATALMLLISAFVLMYDYYEEDGVSELDRRTRSEAKSFAICVGLTILAIVILIIDVILLIIKGGKGGRGATRGRGETTE
ncbi:hypothetical protein HZH66_004674 [Vespula vulgaris]|uniref:MARVEL domain-containing protein n=1 Tax=Vespula vulgaris TaxID=7454 RepID=A0A834NAR4_VESVU|nr:hypothetical protein HZH66_004674 [Vespula vulgaris]